ncbi:EamA family transporter, partial [Aeromicrobium sp. REDSEA-S32_B7]|uniref:EamA family transporter n=1 Tax=Aeromicrobium sp. REDSEA-S32_B7 TaxID=1811526 RepID=UPI000B1F3E11
AHDPAAERQADAGAALGALALLAYLGVLTMALAYALLYAGLRTTSGSAATVATLLEPVTAAAVAAVLLDERIGPLGLLGTALVLAAVVAAAVHRAFPQLLARR